MELISIAIGIQEEADRGGLQGNALEFTYAIGGTIFTFIKFSDKSDAKSKRQRKYSKWHQRRNKNENKTTIC